MDADLPPQPHRGRLRRWTVVAYAAVAMREGERDEERGGGLGNERRTALRGLSAKKTRPSTVTCAARALTDTSAATVACPRRQKNIKQRGMYSLYINNQDFVLKYTFKADGPNRHSLTS